MQITGSGWYGWRNLSGCIFHFWKFAREIMGFWNVILVSFKLLPKISGKFMQRYASKIPQTRTFLYIFGKSSRLIIITQIPILMRTIRHEQFEFSIVFIIIHPSPSHLMKCGSYA